MWASRTKRDLVIEVWEKLDCESVGAAEIEAIETAVMAHFGESAVDSPMIIARIVADEGAELRHSEIMELFVRRRSAVTYEPALTDLIEIRDLKRVYSTLQDLTALRTKYLRANDRKSLKELQNFVIRCKEAVLHDSEKSAVRGITRYELGEIAQWYTIWLQTPDLFNDWIALRSSAPEFIEKFSDQFTLEKNA